MSNPTAPQIDPSPAEKFFGLSARPFSLTPDLRFAYHSRSHTNALEQVTSALRRREGLILVTGAIGTGKTMLCRTMLENFESRTFLSVILDPGLEVEDLLRTVLTDFGIMRGVEVPAGQLSEVTRHQFVATLQQFLSTLVPLQAHAVIMIDEAQRLNARVLEEIRLLTNFETDEAKLLQIVLVGQPELDELLHQPTMQQLNQRVARRCELQPLSESEVGDYVERRLTVAASPAALAGAADTGAIDPTAVVRFAPEAITSVASISRGIPRLINTVCDRALDVAYERQTRVVDSESVVEAASRLRLDVPGELDEVAEPAEKHWVWVAAAVGALIIAALAAWWWLPRPPALVPSRAPVPEAPVIRQTPPAGANSSTTTSPTSPTPTTPPSTSPASSVAPAGRTSTPPERAAEQDPPRQAVAITPPSGGRQTGSGPTRLQITVASFRTEQRATDAVAMLTSMQVSASVRTDSTGTWFRVVAGPFDSRDAAVAAQQTLARGGFEGTQISQFVPEGR